MEECIHAKQENDPAHISEQEQKTKATAVTIQCEYVQFSVIFCATIHEIIW